MSVVVFSKNRPMQLHAYIESLLHFSDLKEKDISVLYANSENISYDKVISSFNSVNWVHETNFYDNLMTLLSASSDYIMFGCDDVVFKNNFSMREAEAFLQKNDDVFGFSFRLGRNIKLPSNCQEQDKFLVWDWTKADTVHYNYPWELDCTLYRKIDVLSIIEQGRSQAYAPNPLEGIVTMNPEGYISRHELACCNSDSKAIVITVNRVQDIVKNSFDGNSITDPAVLAGLYNNDDVKMDIEKISGMSNDSVHVGLEYLVLTNGFSIKREKSFKRNIKRFIKKCIEHINSMGEKIFGKTKIVSSSKFPVILSTQDSLELLRNNLQSFCRFGDGELMLIRGDGIPFQEFDLRLSQNLREIICNNTKNILIGLPYYYFYDHDNFTPTVRNFWLNVVPHCRNIIMSFKIDGKPAIDTAITQIYQTYEKYDFERHFSTWKEIFAGRKIVLVSGEGILKKLDYNLLEDAGCTIEYIYAPTKHAFSELASIIGKVLDYPKDYVVCIILGPTAKPMAVDLTRRGYIACDIGHLLKDYDAYMKHTERTDENITTFYRPD